MKLTRIILIASAGSVLFTGLILSACNKSNSSGSSSTASESDAVTMSASSATADNQYNDVLNVGLQVGAGGSTTIDKADGGVLTGNRKEVDGPGGATPCALLSASITDSTTYPVTVSIDFGTGCTGADGITRKGKITYVFSGRIYTPGTTVAVSFTGYSVNGYQLAGNYSITNTSAGNGISFTWKVVGGQITFPDGTAYTYAGTRNVAQTAGIGTLTLLDDSYSITGSHSYGSSTGKTLTDSITTPLVWPVTCDHLVSGVIGFTYTYSGMSLKGTLDYGSGACDDSAMIKVGATTKTVVLP
ncbi:MAG TPA: hypothetical protein VKQ52_05235 [Puia sp.]|nr:hypothetical protein [Puia sp.]